MENDNVATDQGKSKRGGRLRGSRGSRKPAATSRNAVVPTEPPLEQHKKLNLDRETKLIQKHLASLERAEMMFNNHMGSSAERLPTAIAEVTTKLKERGEALKRDLDRFGAQGAKFLQTRRSDLQRMKVLCESGSNMSDSGLAKLRADLKTLAKDNKVELELSRVVPFEWEPDQLLQQAANFGRVNDIFGSKKTETTLPTTQKKLAKEIEVKPVSTINLGAISMQSENLDARELLSLSIEVQDMLRLQGISDDLLPNICSGNHSTPVRNYIVTRRRARTNQRARGRGRGANVEISAKP